MLNFIRTLRTHSFFRPKLSQEAAEAYFHRLPNQIQVAWFRDGDVIVGKVKTQEHEFMTQGRTADEFIEMVNDALVAAYDIPSEYIDCISQVRAYTPTHRGTRTTGK